MTDVMREKYRALSEREMQAIHTIKDKAALLYEVLDSVGQGREFSLAKTKLEEAVMWATKGITG
jgi:hypothetical protein